MLYIKIKQWYVCVLVCVANRHKQTNAYITNKFLFAANIKLDLHEMLNLTRVFVWSYA